MRHALLFAACGLLSPTLAPSLAAAVSLDPLFTDHAVIQAGKDIPVWGTAADGEKVTVRLAGAEASTVAAAGRWQVRFASLPSTATPVELVATGSTTATAKDILVGDVWLCSGQSNMEWPVAKLSPEDKAEAVGTNLPTMRFFTVKKNPSPTPVTTVEGSWVVASGEAVTACTAVGYYFGRSLVTARKLPIGLIHSSWGGTPAETWTSDEALKAVPSLATIFAGYEKALQSYPARLADYEQKKAAYDKTAAAAKAAGQPIPVPPRKPEEPGRGQSSPSRLYNGMIHPLIPVAITGAIWYQGEANRDRPHQYETLLPTMIADWRGRWGRGEFPFLLVQIAPYTSQPPELREAQWRISQKVPRCGIACTLDVGNPTNIHPLNKRPVGERLARLARTIAYGETIPDSGPRFSALTVKGNAATVAFTRTDGGLVAQGGTVTGFTIAGADQKFVPATATINGDTVTLTSPEVGVPVAVRYAWSNTPEANLANGEGLPAYPFRSDDWPVGGDKN